jgi:hypothetical protein
MLEKNKINRRAFLSKSFKTVVSGALGVMATRVDAYKTEQGKDSTNVVLLPGVSTDVVPPPPPPPHSSHSSRGWR